MSTSAAHADHHDHKPGFVARWTLFNQPQGHRTLYLIFSLVPFYSADLLRPHPSSYLTARSVEHR